MASLSPALSAEGRFIPFRLGTLQFLIFAPMGAFLPLLTVHLKALHFTSFQIALVGSAQAMGALVALFVVGQIADRWLPANRCLTVCAAISGTLLLQLTTCTEPSLFFWTTLLIWLAIIPTMTLGAAICFTHLANPEKDFGAVRAWGTIGWVVQGWLLSYWLSGPTWASDLLAVWRPSLPMGVLTDQFLLGSGMAFCLCAYSMTLPATPPRKGGSLPAPLKALRLLKYRPFAIFLFCHFGMCMTFPFSLQNTPLLLRELGVPEAKLSWVLTIAQSTEIVGLLTLQWILGRLGFRKTILIGLCAWTMALSALMAGQPTTMVIASLGLHGIFICCVLVTGQVFVNKQASADIRTSAQALATFSAGLGMLSGNFLVGWLRDIFEERYTAIFGVAVAIAGFLVVVFLVGFRLLPNPQPQYVEGS